MPQQTWGVLIACGKEQEIAAGSDTSFLGIGPHPALIYSLRAFEKAETIEAVLVAVRKERMDSVVTFAQMYGLTKLRKVLAAAPTRRQTIQNAVNEIGSDANVICLHDAARPCVKAPLINETVRAAAKTGCAVAAMKSADPARLVEKSMKVSEVVDASSLWLIQYPQAFKAQVLASSLSKFPKGKSFGIDESEFVTQMKKPVQVVESPRSNIRVTDREDLQLAVALVGELS